MKIHHTRWILIIIFATLILIDVVDGHVPKIITTILLSVSVIAFSFGYTSVNQRAWFAAGFIFGVLALAGFVYRLVVYT